MESVVKTDSATAGTEAAVCNVQLVMGLLLGFETHRKLCLEISFLGEKNRRTVCIQFSLGFETNYLSVA
jgi:hypothetical protein